MVVKVVPESPGQRESSRRISFARELEHLQNANYSTNSVEQVVDFINVDGDAVWTAGSKGLPKMQRVGSLRTKQATKALKISRNSSISRVVRKLHADCSDEGLGSTSGDPGRIPAVPNCPCRAQPLRCLRRLPSHRASGFLRTPCGRCSALSVQHQ